MSSLTHASLSFTLLLRFLISHLLSFVLKELVVLPLKALKHFLLTQYSRHYTHQSAVGSICRRVSGSFEVVLMLLLT